MSIYWREQLRPGVALRSIVREATASLIAMDAEKLEELALCCADLNRELRETGQMADAVLAMREARSDMELLGRVLQETRANLRVISRLRVTRLRDANFAASRQSPTTGVWGLRGREVEYGDN
jgi:hypothetical protein